MTLFSIADFVEVEDPVRLAIYSGASTPITVPCKVKFVLKSTVLLEVALDAVPDIDQVLVTGLELDAEFLKRGSDSGLMMPTTLRGCKQEGQAISALIEIPYDFKEYFKRRHLRVSVMVPVKIAFNSLGAERVIEGESINLSAGGMRLMVYNHEFMEQDLITVNFQPDKNSKTYTLDAKVVLSRPVKDRKNQYIIAIEFLNVPMSVEDQLVGVCFQLDLKRSHSR